MKSKTSSERSREADELRPGRVTADSACTPSLTRLRELRFERGILVNGSDELFRVGLAGIVLRPGQSLFPIGFGLFATFHLFERGCDRRGAARSRHAADFELDFLGLLGPERETQGKSHKRHKKQENVLLHHRSYYPLSTQATCSFSI